MHNPTPLPPPIPGYYLRHRPRGFAAHFSASPRNLTAVRDLTRAALQAHRIAADAIDSAELIVSELVGNAAAPAATTYRSWSRSTSPRTASP